MVYSWKNYSYKVSADVVGKEFEAIENKYGKLTSELVLQNAESKDSPIHELFDWDDSSAAYKYRLHQASVLICNLSVEVEGNAVKHPIQTRAYVDVSEDNIVGTFINVTSAFKNKDTKEIVLQRAYKELQAFKIKYQSLSELSLVINDMDTLLQKEE